MSDEMRARLRMATGAAAAMVAVLSVQFLLGMGINLTFLLTGGITASFAMAAGFVVAYAAYFLELLALARLRPTSSSAATGQR